MPRGSGTWALHLARLKALPNVGERFLFLFWKGVSDNTQARAWSNSVVKIFPDRADQAPRVSVYISCKQNRSFEGVDL